MPLEFLDFYASNLNVRRKINRQNTVLRIIKNEFKIEMQLSIKYFILILEGLININKIPRIENNKKITN